MISAGLLRLKRASLVDITVETTAIVSVVILVLHSHHVSLFFLDARSVAALLRLVDLLPAHAAVVTWLVNN